MHGIFNEHEISNFRISFFNFALEKEPISSKMLSYVLLLEIEIIIIIIY